MLGVDGREKALIMEQGSYAPNTDKQPVYTKKCKFPSSSAWDLEVSLHV